MIGTEAQSKGLVFLVRFVPCFGFEVCAFVPVFAPKLCASVKEVSKSESTHSYWWIGHQAPSLYL